MHAKLSALTVLFLLIAAMTGGCLQKTQGNAPGVLAASDGANRTSLIQTQYTPGEILLLTAEAEAAANASFNAIAALPPEQRTMEPPSLRLTRRSPIIPTRSTRSPLWDMSLWTRR